MEVLKVNFNLENIEVGKTIRINSLYEGERDCIIVVATENELNLAYLNKERGCIEYQALTVEDIQDNYYKIKVLN
ncbi:TPA: hypothetical protein LR821_004088 [Clostridioides difficile]|uniref:hypothetical protein n=1 Tax=Clostridioides difficile TaxID=1496 RepID=UPI0009393588|nr:hypothetical protein [Clostridioides difficile]EGT4624285.1 hypothetical protein [Clostridioides difficile]MBH7139789.1 hypothetical protein [Clostridioides difficile]MBY1351103.1 hypothetical protein [Clostridioides difficile]MBY1992916.1 hypothetical protein [Clostridioides difficile]MBY2146316.1 hypothetical protein [Clostridioides difficile]